MLPVFNLIIPTLCAPVPPEIWGEIDAIVKRKNSFYRSGVPRTLRKPDRLGEVPQAMSIAMRFKSTLINPSCNKNTELFV